MPFPVFFTDDAARDLVEVYDYIALQDGRQKADHVLEQVERAFSRLSNSPGGVPILGGDCAAFRGGGIGDCDGDSKRGGSEIILMFFEQRPPKTSPKDVMPSR
jgi:hypothetical protein